MVIGPRFLLTVRQTIDGGTMSQKLSFSTKTSDVDAEMLMSHIRAAGLRVSKFGSWGSAHFDVYADGTATGREQVRDVIQDGLRAQFAPTDVIFQGEGKPSEPEGDDRDE